MALKDLVVHLDGTEQADSRLRLAGELARQHGAYLTGLHVTPPLSLPVVPIGPVGYIGPVGDIGTVDFEGLLESWREQQMFGTRRAEDRFHEQLRQAGIEGEFLSFSGPTADIITLYARCSDLSIVGQVDPDHPTPATDRQTAQEVLLSSGRPVLVVPYCGQFDRIADTVLLGWNGTREAARAINDAVPLLGPARLVTLLAINPRGGDIPTIGMVRHLERHGIKVTATHTVAEEIGAGDVLLNYASNIGADLLVVGGYGHSRVREIMLGGVTRSLFREMTLPVFMSH